MYKFYFKNIPLWTNSQPKTYYRMKKISLLLIAFGFLLSCSPKLGKTTANSTTGDKKYKVNTIAFYNVENLFDTIDDPKTLDERSPIMELDPKVRGKVYWEKNRNMAKVISEIGADVSKNAPVIVGVAEIENKRVLEDLINDSYLKDKNYGIVHYDSKDARGIDVALLYQKAFFQPTSSSIHEVVIYDLNNLDKRYYTRDVLLVSGKLDGDEFHFLVNHWPSRFGGEKRSRVNREKAAAVNKRITDSLLGVNPYAKVVIMGDLNDGPYNSSLKNILQAKAERSETDTHEIFNPMENMQKKKGLGTLGYRDAWDLFDQILVTGSLLDKDYSSYRYFKAGIYNPTYLTNPTGRWKGYPFRSYADGQFTGGYSDHFPVYFQVIKDAE